MRLGSKHATCGVALAMLSMTACGSTTNDDGEKVDSEEIAPRLSSRWAGHEVGANPGRWFLRGTFEVQDASKAIVEARVDATLRDAPAAHEESVTRFDFRAKEKLEIRMNPADLRRVAARLDERGYSQGTRDVSAPAETATTDVPKVVSGVDTRVPKGIHEHGLNTTNFNRIGRLSNGCTASFVGTAGDDGYFVLTAAHCVFTEAGVPVEPSFVPRRDGCKRPDGTTISGCDLSPYGTWPSTDVWLPTYFSDNCAGVEPYSASCAAEDIAVLRVTRPSGVTYPGAFAFAAWRRADIDPLYRFNRGYPSCDSVLNPVAPPNCRSSTLFGDSNSCALGEMTHVNPETGWHMLMRHGCDTNGGHSGSPMYVEPTGVPGVSSIFGVHTGGGGTSATPNYVRRITPTWYDQMLNFMGDD